MSPAPHGDREHFGEFSILIPIKEDYKEGKLLAQTLNTPEREHMKCHMYL